MRSRSSSVRPLLPVLRRRASDGLSPDVQSLAAAKCGLRTSINSIACLDHQLAMNPDPLLRWACETDLTAENIVFLRSVCDFKKKWMAAERCTDMDEHELRDQFEDAAVIWFKLVNPLTARYNINIDHRTFLDMEQVFKGLRYEPCFDEDSFKPHHLENVIAPWLEDERPQSHLFEECKISELDKSFILPATDTQTLDCSFTSTEASCSTVPSTFTPDIFDHAYDIVRSDVFHNTWHRFEAHCSESEPASQSLSSLSQHKSRKNNYILCFPIQGCQRVIQACYRRLRPLRPKKFV